MTHGAEVVDPDRDFSSTDLPRASSDVKPATLAAATSLLAGLTAPSVQTIRKLKLHAALRRNLSQSYGASIVIQDHTVLAASATKHRQTCSALTTTRKEWY